MCKPVFKKCELRVREIREQISGNFHLAAKAEPTKTARDEPTRQIINDNEKAKIVGFYQMLAPGILLTPW